MSTPDGGPAFPKYCSHCSDLAVRLQGHQNLCAKHYRFGQMRANAKRHGKTVPTYDKLIELASRGLFCADCNVRMNWLAKKGNATVVTLQHYRDGTFGLVCLSCNTRHAYMQGDEYRTMPKDHKQCPHCRTIKPFSEFARDNGRGGVLRLKSWCRLCSSEAHHAWWQRKTA